MRSRPIFWFVVCLLCMAGAVYFWRLGDRIAASRRQSAATSAAQSPAPAQPVASAVSGALPSQPADNSTSELTSPKTTNAPAFIAAATNRFSYRLGNSSRKVGESRPDIAPLTSSTRL